MCERFTVPGRAATEREFMPQHSWWNYAQKFNVAPSQYVPAIRQHSGESEGVMMRWGLIPSWAVGKPASPGHVTVDLDQLEQGKAFRTAWISSQRCILPVSGFYLWGLTPRKYRQPFFVSLLDRSVFGLAAIWDRWEGEDDDVIESCSLIRVTANDLVANIFKAAPRMPAILRRADYDRWLRGTPGEAKSALRPYDARRMQAHAVSPRINSAAHDDSALIRPIYGSSLIAPRPSGPLRTSKTFGLQTKPGGHSS
jgi:putative SOS response-associated peptidase YedK